MKYNIETRETIKVTLKPGSIVQMSGGAIVLVTDVGINHFTGTQLDSKNGYTSDGWKVAAVKGLFTGKITLENEI